MVKDQFKAHYFIPELSLLHIPQDERNLQIENLADSQEQYQMAFIKCQYTNDYLLTIN